MRKWLLRIFIAIVMLASAGMSYAQQTTKNCCDNATCRDKVVEYATTIAGLASYLGNCSHDDTAATSATLRKLQRDKPDTYNDLIRMVNILNDYLLKDDAKFDGTECLENALPQNNGRNVMCWINYIRLNILKVKPIFPSTEFCGGWKKRIEIGQGASAFLSKQSAYLGAARVYAIYTFQKKNTCGGRFRLMAGPAFFLRGANGYITLSSRIGYRLKDLKQSVFSLGNINLFGGYNTSFTGFNYAEGGLEVELGPIGVNLAANLNTDNSKFGFLVGVFFGNKKKSKSKK